MTANEIIHIYKETGSLTQNQFKSILEDYRTETIEEIRNIPNHQFALDLLNLVIEARQNEDYDIGTGDNIMFASYLLGLHNKIEDSLKIWEAKSIDFDSLCYVDIQLVVFAGVEKTLSYLKSIPNEKALNAINYIEECQKAGDFDDLETYFLTNNMPWWI